VGSPHRPLFERQIPDIPSMRTVLQECSLLLGCRIDPEARHAVQPISRDRQSPVREGRESRFLPAQNLWATPRRLM
jgi:hypothetical protein